jgi:hypothetical protein
MLLERISYETSGCEASSARVTDKRAIAGRLADWSIQAKLAGRAERAEYLLLRAWEALELVSDDGF